MTDRPEGLSAEEAEIMTRMSAYNPKSRSHREERLGGWSSWQCIPIRDAVDARAALLEKAWDSRPVKSAAVRSRTESDWSFEGLTGDGWAIIGPDDQERHGDWSASGYGRAIALDRADAERIVAALNRDSRPVGEGPRVLRAAGEDAQAADLIDALEERGIYSRGDLDAALADAGPVVDREETEFAWLIDLRLSTDQSASTEVGEDG